MKRKISVQFLVVLSAAIILASCDTPTGSSESADSPETTDAPGTTDPPVSTPPPTKYIIKRDNPFYKILTTYTRTADGRVVPKNSLYLKAGDTVPEDLSVTEFSPADQWQHEYAFLKIGAHLDKNNFPGLLSNEQKVITKSVSSNMVYEYQYDFYVFDGVHICSASGNAAYYYTPVAKQGTYLGESKSATTTNFGYGKGCQNGLKMADIVGALGAAEPTGPFQISFLPQAFANSNCGNPRLVIGEYEAGGSGWKELAWYSFTSSKVPLTSSSDIKRLDVQTFTTFKNMFLFLEQGDWGASVVVLSVEALTSE